jgi:hypothetical protein
MPSGYIREFPIVRVRSWQLYVYALKWVSVTAGPSPRDESWGVKIIESSRFCGIEPWVSYPYIG